MLVNAETLSHIRRMNELRKRIGRPMRVDSGYRTVAFNASVGGEVDSNHLLGIACDVPLPAEIKAGSIAQRNAYQDKLRDLWLTICQSDGLGGGFGYYDTFNHFDSRVVQSVFDNRTILKIELKTSGSIKYIEVNPLSLKYVDLSKSPKLVKDITYRNFANGSLFFPGVRPICLVVQDGVKIYDARAYDIKPKGTLIIYKDGKVEVKTLRTINNVSNIKLAFQGFNLNYGTSGTLRMSILAEGYLPDVYRECNRVGFGYNGNLVIANVFGTAEILRKAMRTLGCIQDGNTVGIGVDSGSRNAFKVNGQIISNGGATQEHIIIF